MAQIQAGSIDIMVMPEKLYQTLKKNEPFTDLKELMGEEAFEKSGMQTDTTHISITDSELEQELGVIYDPVCIAVPYSAPNQENAVKWIKSLTAGNKLWYANHTKTGCGFFSLVTNMNSFRRTIIIQQCRDNCVAFLLQWNRERKKEWTILLWRKTDSAASLASMAMPMVLSMLVNSLYNIVDSFLWQRSVSRRWQLCLWYFLYRTLLMQFAIGFGVGINAQISFSAGEQKILKCEYSSYPWYALLILSMELFLQ